MADPQPLPAEQRGRLLIDDRVVEKVAAIAAREVPGSIRVGAGWDRFLKRTVPSADAKVAGGRVRITVDVAAHWPTPLADLSAAVRDNVTTRVQQLLDLTVDAVNVNAINVIHDKTQERRVQ